MRVTILGAGGMLATAVQSVFKQHALTELFERDCDITDAEAVERVLPGTRPDVILNMAAFANVDACEEKEDFATRVNGDAVGIVARVAKQLDAVLVHISTDFVFDGLNPAGYTEDARPHPINAYGRSKARGEALLEASGAKYYLVRTSWLYGPHGKNFVDTMRQLGHEKKTLNVVNDQHGAPTYTVDLAQALHELVMARLPFGTYHRTNSGETTWYDYACEIFKQLRLPVVVNPVTSREFPRPARRPTVSTLQTAKLSPLRSWNLALADYLRSTSL